MSQSSIKQLLQRVGMRQQVVYFGQWVYRFAMALAIVYALLILASRLFGVIPDVFTWQTLLTIPGAALILALGFARRPADHKCARLVDQSSQSKDLFLTAALIDKSPGEYKPLVTAAAQAKAQQIRPTTVVPFDPWRKSGHVSVALLVLLAGITFLPQLDPFGKEQHREKQAQRRERLEQTRKATARRAEALERRDHEARNTPQVRAAMEQLKQDFRRMKKDDPTGNLRKMQEQMQNVGNMWKKQHEKFEQALKERSTSQRFGAMQTQQSREWKQQMAAGKTEAVQKELTEVKQLAQKMAETKDAKKREQIRKQLEERLEQLKDFAAGQTGAKSLSEALQRALQQMDMGQMEGLSTEAMEGLAESLDLSSAELEELAQSMRDMKSLEEAMDALRQAQGANSGDPLDGEQCGSCNSMADYAELYRQMTQGQGQGGGLCEGCQSGGSCQGGSCSGTGGQGSGAGAGGGMGGPGRGRGGIAPEDDSITTDYKTERARSRLQAGKILMQWKTNEVSEAGKVNRDYSKSLQKVKQGVMEAIVQEEVPPGYHDAIKEYFDTIDEKVVQPQPK